MATPDRLTPLIEARGVTFRYPTARTAAVQNVNLTLYPGDRALVIGHNGSGKSTLLSLLAGRRMPQSGGGGGAAKANPTTTTPPPSSTGVASGSGGGTIRVLGRDPFDDTTMAQHIALIGSPWPPEAYFATTVDRVATPAPVPERKTAIADALHLRVTRQVDKMSSGEKRRVQILHGTLYPATVYLLDECSTDIDVAERKTVLDLVRRECESRGGCCLYATHILDRVHDWATHVMLFKEGRVVAYLPVSELDDCNGDAAMSLEKYALQFMSGGASASEADGQPRFGSPTTTTDTNGTVAAAVSTPSNGGEEPAVAIDCQGLSYRDVFTNMSFRLYHGERVLLCGCNGAGKSTLLNMLGGKQFFPNENSALKVLGKACYDDMTLNALVSYGGDWWTRVPGGEMHVRDMLTIDNARAERLRCVLAVNLDWDVRHISSGEQKRVQILLHLLVDRPIVLLDEATADLDIDQRHALLSFLYEENVTRGVTVMYATHIFGGLDGWASAVVLLDRTVRGVHALWRAADGESLSLDRVAAELVALKAREVF